VLFVDVLRPLRFPARQFNRGLISVIGRSPYIQDARGRHEEWERRFAAQRAAGDA
jgi:beta-hydroxylase